MLTGCSVNTKFLGHESAKTKASAEEKSAEAFDGVKKSTVMPELDEYTEKCLEYTDKVNSNGYILDESFYLWFYGRYGEVTYKKLADSLEEGEDSSVYQRLTGNTLHVLWIFYCADLGVHKESLENVYIKDSDNSTDIVMNFAGDINFDENWETIRYADRNHIGIQDCLIDGLIDETRDADIMMVNNEFSYGNKGTPLAGKAYTFQARPDRARNMKILGVDIVSVANNHVFDYGATGLNSTLETLEEYKIPYVGAGRNLEEASKIVYFVINGKKIAYTAATQIERTYNYTKEATANTPGVLKTLNADKYVKVIKEAKKNADYVIAFVHWGTEGKVFFENDQVDLGRKFVNAGADAVVGGHTHCLQGIEFYNDVPVFYSLGNFWFDWSEDNSHATGMIQIVLHEDGSCDYRFIPCYYDEYKTRLLNTEKERKAAYKHMEKLSYEIEIDKEGYITQK